MGYVEVTNFINALVDTIKEHEKQFMLTFTFQADSINEISIPRRNIRLLVDARSRYIGIWIDDSNSHSTLEVKSEDFKYQCNHDSCWRTDGMQWVFKNYMEMLHEFLKALGNNLALRDKVKSSIRIGPYVFFKNSVEFDVKDRTVVNFKLRLGQVQN